MSTSQSTAAERAVLREGDAAKVHPAVVRRVRHAQQDKEAVHDVRRVEPRDEVLLQVLRELLEPNSKVLFAGGLSIVCLLGLNPSPLD